VLQSAFVPEQVEAVVKKVSGVSLALCDWIQRVVSQIVESQLTDVAYDDDLVEHWIDSICSDCLSELAALNKPFKYLGKFCCCFLSPGAQLVTSFTVSCVIMQNTGAGLTSQHSSYCDGVNDGS